MPAQEKEIHSFIRSTSNEQKTFYTCGEKDFDTQYRSEFRVFLAKILKTIKILPKGSFIAIEVLDNPRKEQG